ncbi:hypothetical protein A5874_000299, partial [Enterococcus faecium]
LFFVFICVKNEKEHNTSSFY